MYFGSMAKLYWVDDIALLGVRFGGPICARIAAQRAPRTAWAAAFQPGVMSIWPMVSR
jgi:hypothetical protein